MEINKLARQYRNWCKRNFLPLMSADELLVEGIWLSDTQYAWIRNFQERWEKAC